MDILGGIQGQSVEGYNASQLNDLAKALGTGTQEGGSLGEAYVDGGAPFRVQSLEQVLKVVTFQDRNIVFWKDIPKMQAYNTVEEINVLTSYGGQGSGFFQEGGLPKANDSEYERRAALIKFMGTTGQVTHPLTLIRSAHGDVIGREAKNRTIDLLRMMEIALFKGDSTLNPLAFDGLEKQIKDEVNAQTGEVENILDLRGAPLDEETMENIARISADNYGYITNLYAGNKALTDLAKQVLPQGRFSLPYGNTDGRLGYRVSWFDAQNGSYELKPNVFLRPGGAPKQVADSDAPAAPSITSAVAGAVGAGEVSKFTATSTDVVYKVAAVNAAGESLASAEESVTVAAGEKVTVTVPAVANATAIKVYRGATAATVKEMVTVPAGSPTVIVDLNDDLPGTAKAYGVMMDSEQGLAFKQLAPLMKMDLAVVAAAYRFMILLYGVPVVYAPLKMVVVKNIGSL